MTFLPDERVIMGWLAKGPMLKVAGSSRPADRAKQRLRKAGLIEYSPSPDGLRRWRLTDAGRVAWEATR